MPPRCAAPPATIKQRLRAPANRAPVFAIDTAQTLRFLSFALVAGLACALPQQIALGSPTTSAVATTPEGDLPTLPAAPKLEPAAPEPTDVEDLGARIQRLLSEDPEDRREALKEVLEARSKLIPAIFQRFDKLAARADRERMKRAMAQVRDKSRGGDSGEGNPRGAADPRSDLLMELVDKARPKDEGWRELTELVAMSRMFTQIGNVHAARGLIEVYVRFGEFMRVDVQNRLLDLKDGAVAALIEARRHRAEKVARWAERQLDRLGKGVPGEAIRTDNFEVLADVLRAYGRVKDPDAARIVVSYASSERFQLREAARQSIAMLGEVGIWQLRDAYENVSGKRPRRDWSWERTARELFYEYDRLHVAKIYELLEAGNKAAAEGRLEEMAKAYDSLLARAPQFDKAASLAPGYFNFAVSVAKSQPAQAQAALVRVERLSTDVALKRRAQSLRDTIRAEQLIARGVVDTYLLTSAIERDPNNRRAKELLSYGDRAMLEAQTRRMRWITSGAIALVAVVAIVFVLFRRRKDLVGATPIAAHGPMAPDGPVVPMQDSVAESAPSQAATSAAARDDKGIDAAALEPSTASRSDVASSSQEAPSSAPAQALEATVTKRRDPFEDL